MLNDSQQRKAMLLSLLMVMLAQTAYTESYRGWTLAEQANPSLLNAGCDGLSRPAGTPIYVDAAQGSDDAHLRRTVSSSTSSFYALLHQLVAVADHFSTSVECVCVYT